MNSHCASQTFIKKGKLRLFLSERMIIVAVRKHVHVVRSCNIVLQVYF